MTLPFRATPMGATFKRKIDDIFKELPNVIGISDDILGLGHDTDGTDHTTALWGHSRYAEKKPKI